MVPPHVTALFIWGEVSVSAHKLVQKLGCRNHGASPPPTQLLPPRLFPLADKTLQPRHSESDRDKMAATSSPGVSHSALRFPRIIAPRACCQGLARRPYSCPRRYGTGAADLLLSLLICGTRRNRQLFTISQICPNTFSAESCNTDCPTRSLNIADKVLMQNTHTLLYDSPLFVYLGLFRKIKILHFKTSTGS